MDFPAYAERPTGETSDAAKLFDMVEEMCENTEISQNIPKYMPFEIVQINQSSQRYETLLVQKYETLLIQKNKWNVGYLTESRA